MSRKNVKKNLYSHSEAKVRLLGEYIRRYLSVIGNDRYTYEINVYDLFCGEGIYDNGGEGSSMVLMRAINEVYKNHKQKFNRFPKINAHFNDIDSNKVNKTKAAISSNSLIDPGLGTTNYSSSDYKIWLKKLKTILAKQNNEKSFIFLDPYEYKHIKISHIKSLMSNNKTEVLLWLPTQFMYRFEKNGTPTALKDFIEELVPYEQWKSSNDVWDFIEELTSAFQDAMGNGFFVDRFTIQKNKNEVFCLFFFTSHIKGFEKMLESKWKIDNEEGKGWSYSESQLNLFSEIKTNKLATKLEESLLKSNRTNGELYEFTLRKGFLPKHTNEILTSWQVNGNISVSLSDGSVARKKSFYINYTNYRDDYDKVTVSLQRRK